MLFSVYNDDQYLPIIFCLHYDLICISYDLSMFTLVWITFGVSKGPSCDKPL